MRFQGFEDQQAGGVHKVIISALSEVALIAGRGLNSGNRHCPRCWHLKACTQLLLQERRILHVAILKVAHAQNAANYEKKSPPKSWESLTQVSNSRHAWKIASHRQHTKGGDLGPVSIYVLPLDIEYNSLKCQAFHHVYSKWRWMKKCRALG